MTDDTYAAGWLGAADWLEEYKGGVGAELAAEMRARLGPEGLAAVREGPTTGLKHLARGFGPEAVQWPDDAPDRTVEFTDTDRRVVGAVVDAFFDDPGSPWPEADTIPAPRPSWDAAISAELPPITVYVDGSQRANGDGGWAWWVSPELFASGAERLTTNNVMELWACVEAIEAFTSDVPLRIVSDSAYVTNCFLERWYDDWRARGWKNSKREPVANQALWEELLAVVEAHRAPIEWVHIRGHGKVNSRGERPDPLHVHGNDQADRLAQAASAGLSA